MQHLTVIRPAHAHRAYEIAADRRILLENDLTLTVGVDL